MADEQGSELQASSDPVADNRADTLQAAAERAAQEERARAERQEQKPRRSLWGLLGIVVLIIVVVLVLLLLRDCGRGSGASEGSSKTIEEVSGLKPMPGLVSVWVRADKPIEDVTAAAGREVTDVLSMGEGRYVLSVPPGTEQDTADALIAVDGVHDAGLVYTQPVSAETTAP